MPDDDREFQAIKRKLTNARREIIKAVDRASAVDLRPGHIAEARRRCIAVRDAADEALRELNR